MLPPGGLADGVDEPPLPSNPLGRHVHDHVAVVVESANFT
jgi:hypothetical protein